MALTDVSLDVRVGECHALMGENGAGKSTLARIVAGALRPDGGELFLAGEGCSLSSPADALARGVAMVHQELSSCPDLSVAENMLLGRMPRRGGIFVDRERMLERARALLQDVGVDLDVSCPMRELSTAQEQLVQIAAAVGTGARVLLLDEPTSSLSEGEAGHLFALLESLERRGLTLIYVSHRLPEVLRLCDRVSVLRDGRLVATLARDEVDEAAIVRLMIGRDLVATSPGHLERTPGPPVLTLRDLSSPGGFRDGSLGLRAGEIVGLAGLVGAGRSALAQAVFGLDPAVTGEVRVGGLRLRPGSPPSAMRSGLALVPEDRKRQGLVPTLDVVANHSLASLERLRRGPFLDRDAERRVAAQSFLRLRVRTPSLQAPVTQLSGGNQQKIVLARWLARHARVLLVDEPTRGVDVGAKEAIHALLDELACGGAAILLVSSDLPELLALSTRVLVMRAGRLVAELDREAATSDAVLGAMAGVGA